MKIMVITADHITDHMGGTRAYTHELNRFLVKRGNIIKHICYLGGQTESKTVDGVTIDKIVEAQKNGISYYFKRLFRVRKFIKFSYRTFCPDIVLIDSARTVQYLIVNVIPKAEIVYFVHAMNSHEIVYDAKIKGKERQNWLADIIESVKVYIRASLMWVFEEVSLARCSKIITVSKFDLSEINRFHGSRFNKKVDIIPIGIDLDKYKIRDTKQLMREKYDLPRDKCVFITVRRLAPRMGIENLLKAINSLSRDDYVLLLCGKGELATKIEKIIEDKDIQDNVRYLGYVSEKKKIELLCASDVFVLPTKELEGFGIVILEALATNTPVIGTPVGAIPEVLRSIGDQFITEDATPTAIEKKLSWAIQNRENIVETDFYRHVVEKYYDWDKLVIDIENALSPIIHNA